jgi:hypothetical protein
MSAMSAIQFDKTDEEYYKDMLKNELATYVLLLDLKDNGLMGASKVNLDAYHDSAFNSYKSTIGYECKTQLCTCCLLCSGCWASYSLCMQIDNRTKNLKFNKNDVKTFLSNQELKSRSFTREQLESMKNRAQTALESNDMGKIMKEAEELDLIERRQTAGGQIMQSIPMQMGDMNR